MQLKSLEPVRIDLGPGAVAVCDPIQPHDYLRAKGRARDLVLAAGEGEPHDLYSRYRCALIAALVHRPGDDAPPERPGGLRALEGVADVDGSPIEGQPTAAQVDRLLAWYPAHEAFERQYAGPLLEAEAEKNGLSPSQGGSSTPRAAKATAEDASPTTDGAAPNAPPSSTSRAARKGKGSGKS